MTGQVIQTGENRQIIFNCSVVGIHNTNTVLEFRFNDDKSYSCRKKRWPYEPEDNRDKPHAHLLDDNTTCQLLIPNAIITHLEDYYCRAELWIWPEESQSSCYLLSETVTLSEASITDAIREHKSYTTTIIITISAAIILILLLIVAVVVVKKMKYCCQHGQERVIDETIGTVNTTFKEALSRKSLGALNNQLPKYIRACRMIQHAVRVYEIAPHSHLQFGQASWANHMLMS